MSEDILSASQFADYFKDIKFVSRHNSSTEERIPHPWLEVDLKNIVNILKELSTTVLDVMDGIPEQDAELKHLRAVTNALPQIQHSPPKKVALVGAQGAGKSLLINALFDIDGLSLTGADGGACTSAIIQYAFHPSGQNEHGETKKFLAAVHFLDAVKLEEMLKEHARSYHQFHADDSDDDSDGESTKKTKHFRRDDTERRLKDTAEEIFHTLFGGKNEFQDAWYTNDYRNGEFVQVCQMKCKEALSQLDMNSQNIATFCGRTPQELLKQIRRFMTNVRDEVSLWPLVDIISVRFDHPLLGQNIVMFDLPGWGDVNLSRTRHTDQMKDSVGYEFIVADTIRIATDETVISNARSSILNHGAANTKLIATKIDCSGPAYSFIQSQISQADSDLAEADDEDDHTKKDQAEKYKIYLQRKLKEHKIYDRKQDIAHRLLTQLKSPAGDELVQLHHISAGDYMGWISTDKIRFRDQPALDPERTGIPEIRRLLYHLPAQSNFDDTRNHLFVTVPAFLEKIRRVTTDSDRDIGFKNLADDFDEHQTKEIARLLSECKKQFHIISSANIRKAQLDSAQYKNYINDLMEQTLLSYKAPSFNRIMKSKGLVLSGTSRSKDIEGGCDYNKELAKILASVFQKWHRLQMESFSTMHQALKDKVEALYMNVLCLLTGSEAGISTIDRAKKRWEKFQFKLQTIVDKLMDSLVQRQNFLLRRATMEDDRQNSLIPFVADGLWERVFLSCPELKPNTDPKKKRYTMTKTAFRKIQFRELFLDEDHIMDKVMKAFQSDVDNSTNALLDSEIGNMSKALNTYSTALRAQAPIPYTVTKVGAKIRSDLVDLLPKLQARANDLSQFLPQQVKQENDCQTAADQIKVSQFNLEHIKPTSHTLSFYLDQNSKRKTGRDERKVKVKQEPGTKRLKLW